MKTVWQLLESIKENIIPWQLFIGIYQSVGMSKSLNEFNWVGNQSGATSLFSFDCIKYNTGCSGNGQN